MSCTVTKLHSAVKDFPARGGASVVEVGGKVIVFGGADREQTHFQDMLVYGGDAGSNFSAVKATGDVPMPRSGHGSVAYGKYMFLFGGIDFAEEAVFNDLYILDTDTFQWGYVGESGEEVIARNSHSLGIVRVGETSCLVVYGGASPEHGPLGDALLAALPAIDTIDMESIYVKWERLGTAAAASVATVLTASVATAASTQTPGTREMHGTSCYDGCMYITGGRNEHGALLTDVWVLSALASDSVPSADVDGSATAHAEREVALGSRLGWTRLPALSLPAPRCSHGSAIVATVVLPVAVTAGETEAAQPSRVAPQLVLVGGFTTSGISAEVLSIALPHSGTTAVAGQSWRALTPSQAIVGRFGVAACSASMRFVSHISSNKKYGPVFNARAKEALAALKAGHDGLAQSSSAAEQARAREHAAVVLFGGVCLDQDFADLHLLLVN